MNRAVLASILMAATGLCQAGPAPFPRDVTEFLAIRESCDYWRGEEGYDEERKAVIAQATCETCQGTDAKLAGLKRKYRTDARIIEKLSEFDPKIEPNNKAAARDFCRSMRKPKWAK
jgi:hypothetical protein